MGNMMDSIRYEEAVVKEIRSGIIVTDEWLLLHLETVDNLTRGDTEMKHSSFDVILLEVMRKDFPKSVEKWESIHKWFA